VAEEAAKVEQIEKKQPAKRSSSRQSPTEAAVRSFLRSMSSMLGREIMRGILGAVTKGWQSSKQESTGFVDYFRGECSVYLEQLLSRIVKSVGNN
jgi:hypothetical protein